MSDSNKATLRYLRGESVTIALKKHPLSIRHTRLTFTPTLEVDKFLAQKILRNPRWMGWFGEEFIPPPSFVCQICGFVAKSRLGLAGHGKAHSDTIPHTSKSTNRQHRRQPLTSELTKKEVKQ